jgi:trigger factor
LRYQLIEGQLAKDNNIQVTFDDLRSFAKNLLKIQYAQYGQELMNDEFLDGVADQSFAKSR